MLTNVCSVQCKKTGVWYLENPLLFYKSLKQKRKETAQLENSVEAQYVYLTKFEK
jgi:hypothetical protein